MSDKCKIHSIRQLCICPTMCCKSLYKIGYLIKAVLLLSILTWNLAHLQNALKESLFVPGKILIFLTENEIIKEKDILDNMFLIPRVTSVSNVREWNKYD